VAHLRQLLALPVPHGHRDVPTTAGCWRARSSGGRRTPCQRDGAGVRTARTSRFTCSRTSEKHAFLTDSASEKRLGFSKRANGPGQRTTPVSGLSWPMRCVAALGRRGRRRGPRPVLRQRTTGLAALSLGCSYVGFEIDPRKSPPPTPGWRRRRVCHRPRNAAWCLRRGLDAWRRVWPRRLLSKLGTVCAIPGRMRRGIVEKDS